MDYNSARAYVKSLAPRGIVPGLAATSALLSRLGDPQDKLQIIHIAGTNGKGSVGAFLEAMLIADGKRVCRFATPAVGEYLEQFTLNSRPISEDLYAAAAEKVRNAIEELEMENIFPTSFEAEAALAFLIFAGLSPDHALIECGMGGALDATNIIKKPEVSVITSISYDHMQFLGNSIEEIAEAKAGIIKPGTPVVTVRQPDAVMSVIRAGAEATNSPLYMTDSINNIEFHRSYTGFEYGGKEYSIKLLGTFQPQNAALAINVAELLDISDKAVLSGLQNAQWHYRFERVGRFILDGAHNEDAAKKLSASLRIYTTPADTAFICGCFRDKEYDRIAALTAPLAAAVYCVTPPTGRGLESAVLCETFKKHGAKAYDAKTVPAAIRSAIIGGWRDIVVFGSLSILYEARRLAEETQN